MNHAERKTNVDSRSDTTHTTRPLSARSQRLALVAMVAIVLLVVPITGAQEESLNAQEEAVQSVSGDTPLTKAGTYSCSTTGCTGTFSSMVASLRTLNNGAELIILHTAVANALRAAGACTSWPGEGLIVDGAGKDTIVSKLYLGLALDTRFHLRVASSGVDCKIFYVRVFT